MSLGINEKENGYELFWNGECFFKKEHFKVSSDAIGRYVRNDMLEIKNSGFKDYAMLEKAIQAYIYKHYIDLTN